MHNADTPSLGDPGSGNKNKNKNKLNPGLHPKPGSGYEFNWFISKLSWIVNSGTRGGHRLNIKKITKNN